MKKLFLFLTLFAFIACTENNDFLDDLVPDPSVEYGIGPLLAGDGELDVLGMGYDITGDYLSPASVKSPVLDIERYQQRYPRRIVTGTSSWGQDNMSYGYSAVDYASNIAISASAKLKISKDLLFTGSLKTNSFFGMSTAYTTKNSFASLDIIRHRKYIYINDEVDRLVDYVSEDFLEDVERLSPERLIKRYGTHVLIDFTLGGRYKLVYKSTLTNIRQLTVKGQAVKAGLGSFLSDINFRAGGGFAYNESLAVENHNKELMVQFYGGTGSNLQYNLETSMPTSVDIAGWEDRLNLSNSVLTDVNWEETYPIYEFISDPVKKEQVKNAVLSYIEDSKVEEIEVALLRSHATLVNQWTFLLFNVLDDVPGWHRHGISAYVSEHPREGMVPLYQHIHGCCARIYSTLQVAPGCHTNEGIVCYVYNYPAEGTVPLYQHSQFYGVRTYCTMPSLPGWACEGITCYVYPLD